MAAPPEKLAESLELLEKLQAALHLGYAVATLNVRHFRLIPGLSVIRL